MNNIFLGGGDPLLSTGQPLNYDAQIAELQRMQQALELQKQQIGQARPEAATGSPVWDEIEKLTAELSDKEFSYISNCDEFNKSQQAIAEALQAEYTKLMRPIVERNHRQLLDDHLQLLKRLRKDAGREIDKRMELFNEYVTTSPDIPFAEFIKNKKAD
jgi:hypothetical protein